MIKGRSSQKKNSIFRHNPYHLFEDETPIVRAGSKFDTSLFVLGSNSKKKPNCLTFGRTYDGQLLDMAELRITSYKSSSNFEVGFFWRKMSKFSLFLAKISNFGHFFVSQWSEIGFFFRIIILYCIFLRKSAIKDVNSKKKSKLQTAATRKSDQNWILTETGNFSSKFAFCEVFYYQIRPF